MTDAVAPSSVTLVVLAEVLWQLEAIVVESDAVVAVPVVVDPHEAHEYTGTAVAVTLTVTAPHPTLPVLVQLWLEYV